jgi:hypothetical protein
MCNAVFRGQKTPEGPRQLDGQFLPGQKLHAAPQDPALNRPRMADLETYYPFVNRSASV